MKAFIDKISAMERLSYTHEEIRPALCSAMELVQSLNLSSKVLFAELASRLGCKQFKYDKSK